jgi:hypothetical protein
MKMEIKITEYWDDYECEVYREKMEVDGKNVFGVANLSECPEDARIGRDLTDSDQVVKLMQLAFDAGKNGEEFIVADRTREKVED